jgi:hypothetical protein
MKTSNLVTESLREVLSGAQGTLAIAKRTAFRVRAAGATTVTIAGVLAMTMTSGEIAIFNTGEGVAANQTVAVIIGAANAFVQVGREVTR